MAILTTAGISKYNAAVANNSKILIKKIVFGSNTGTVSQATTSIGSTLYESNRINTSYGLVRKKISFSCFIGLPAATTWSQVGIYDDTNTLIAVDRVNLPAASAQLLSRLFALVLNCDNPEVFDSLQSSPNYLASTKSAIRVHKSSTDLFESICPPAQEGSVYKYSDYRAIADNLLVRANIVETQAEFNLAKNSIPSMEEMFNSWYRFSHSTANNGLNYPANAAELQGWELTANKELRTTINSETLIGFVSPDKYLNYEIVAQIYSTDRDDDSNGIVIAFNKEDREYTLTANRCLGGNGVFWKLFFNWGQGGANQILLANKASSVLGGDGLYHDGNGNPPYVQNGGWNRADIASGTRVRVVRNGDIITAQCSDFGSTTLLPDSLITINMADWPQLAPLRKPASYGYCSYSQRYSYWNTTKFINKDNYILNLMDNKIYTFNGSTWIASAQQPLSFTGINKFIYSTVNRKTYYADHNGNIRKVA